MRLLLHHRLPYPCHLIHHLHHHSGTAAKRLSPNLSMSTSASELTTTRNQQEQKQNEELSQVLKYHNDTKHSFNKYARGPHGLDWANQPNPFRRYISAPILPLIHPPTPNPNPLLYHTVFTSLPSPEPITKATISRFFFDSLALSAWKSTGFSTWSLRVNPSSGNLHPTEAYIIAPPIDHLSTDPFVAHYSPKDHSLEIRAQIPSGFFLNNFPENSFLIGISSVFWREAWKYGERAFRYCNHDVGHAIAAVSMAGAGLGWDVKVLDGLGFKELEKLMGLEGIPKFDIPDRPIKGKIPEIEYEHPDCVLLISPSGTTKRNEVNYEELSLSISEFSNLEWKGKPNSLSKEHICWDIIYKTAEAVKKPLTKSNGSIQDPFYGTTLFSESSYKKLSLSEVIRKRRSAVDMDGNSYISKETFYQILLHCMPSGSGRPLSLPFRTLSWDSEVHAVLFVHRVEDFPSGLYFLVRNENHFDELKSMTRSEFKWVKPNGCPDDLPLYELSVGDFRDLSKRLSCHQDIASDGCFSLGMVARFEETMREKGVWMYPRLFWESGVLGQVLYLEAHAVGISATGIGCFLDDPVHEVLGLRGLKYQSLYHFTIGSPVLDKRITSLPAYPGPSVDA